MNWYSDVFDLVFPSVDPKQANDLWKAQLAKPVEDKVGKDNGRSDEDDE